MVCTVIARILSARYIYASRQCLSYDTSMHLVNVLLIKIKDISCTNQFGAVYTSAFLYPFPIVASSSVNRRGPRHGHFLGGMTMYLILNMIHAYNPHDKQHYSVPGRPGIQRWYKRAPPRMDGFVPGSSLPCSTSLCTAQQSSCTCSG